MRNPKLQHSTKCEAAVRTKIEFLIKDTHSDSRQFDAVPAERLHDIEHTLMAYDVIGIDEGQFVSRLLLSSFTATFSI